MKKQLNIKKLILLNLPYILMGLFSTNFGEAWRMAVGADASAKMLSFFSMLPVALASWWPSLHPLDLLVGLCGGGGLRLAVYLKSKNAKKYRHGMEYGSARWGTHEDIAPYIDPVFQNNVILTKTESLTMNSRPKDPKTARNKNVLVIGGSGSGKTRFWLKPNLMQMHSSYVVTDPKGTILVECGKMLQRGAPKLGKDGKPMKDKHGKVIYEPYRIKVLNTINFKKSMHYNPFASIWTAETLSKAMEVCDDPILSLALNLAFSCSLRIGEMLGLTWDCIDIAPQSIENGSAYIFVNKELQRVTRGALDDLSDKGVIKKFPPCIASTHTALVLKEPKTKTSIRRVYLPKTVAYMLVERKKEIDELMDLFGDEYIDNNLVFCSSNGRPMESQVINRAFNKLIKENGLPHVVFHSLRHSSITYKLKLNGGDMKSVQGDSGHAQVKMVADVYSHIIDEDRCINAQRLEEAFYSSKTPDPVEDTEPKTADTAVTESDAAKILELLKNPETAALLKQLAKAL